MSTNKEIKYRHSSFIPPTNLANYTKIELLDSLMKVESDRGPKKDVYYCKHYDLDDVPCREHDKLDVSRVGSGDNRPARLTESQLNDIERRVFETVSRQLRTEGVSQVSLDKNIKFFKSTVQDILDNFFKSVKDFEEYKEKLNKFLAKNKEASTTEMETFIKDMISHIMSESNVSNDTRKWSETVTFADNREAVTPLVASSNTTTIAPPNSSSSKQLPSSHHSVSIEFKNNNYQADNSTIDSLKKYDRREDILNIFLMGNGVPHLEIKVNDRNLVSEINFSRLCVGYEGQVASAENIRKVSAKKLQIENYSKMQDADIPDREFPVKMSQPKKNIHLDEDFTKVEKVDRRSLMTRLCNFLCKKLRKS